MEFNAKNSRSVVLKNGKLSERFKFRIAGEAIPNVKDQPIRCLCKLFDNNLKDTTNKKNIGDQSEH